MREALSFVISVWLQQSGPPVPGDSLPRDVQVLFLYGSPARGQPLKKPSKNVSSRSHSGQALSSFLINACFPLGPQHLARVLSPEKKFFSFQTQSSAPSTEGSGCQRVKSRRGSRRPAAQTRHAGGLQPWKPAPKTAGALAEHSPLAGQTCLPPRESHRSESLPWWNLEKDVGFNLLKAFTFPCG